MEKQEEKITPNYSKSTLMKLYILSKKRNKLLEQKTCKTKKYIRM